MGFGTHEKRQVLEDAMRRAMGIGKPKKMPKKANHRRKAHKTRKINRPTRQLDLSY
jgi:hypothetical protein